MENTIVIERDADQPLALIYPTSAEAMWALNGSVFVDDMCATNCTDCYITRQIPEGAETIIAPTQSEEAADLAA